QPGSHAPVVLSERGVAFIVHVAQRIALEQRAREYVAGEVVLQGLELDLPSRGLESSIVAVIKEKFNAVPESVIAVNRRDMLDQLQHAVGPLLLQQRLPQLKRRGAERENLDAREPEIHRVGDSGIDGVSRGAIRGNI